MKGKQTLDAGSTGRQVSVVGTSCRDRDQQSRGRPNQHGLVAIGDEKSKQGNCPNETHQTDAHQDVGFHFRSLPGELIRTIP